MIIVSIGERRGKREGNTLEHLKKGGLEVTIVLKMIKTLGRGWMSLKNGPTCFYEPLCWVEQQAIIVS